MIRLITYVPMWFRNNIETKAYTFVGIILFVYSWLINIYLEIRSQNQNTYSSSDSSELVLGLG